MVKEVSERESSRSALFQAEQSLKVKNILLASQDPSALECISAPTLTPPPPPGAKTLFFF